MDNLLKSREKYSNTCKELIIASEKDLIDISKSVEEIKKELAQEKNYKQELIKEKETKENELTNLNEYLYLKIVIILLGIPGAIQIATSEIVGKLPIFLIVVGIFSVLISTLTAIQTLLVHRSKEKIEPIKTKITEIQQEVSGKEELIDSMNNKIEEFYERRAELKRLQVDIRIFQNLNIPKEDIPEEKLESDIKEFQSKLKPLLKIGP
ncbi:MAG: hypothetical protein ACFFB0_21320 [Promethearchaeota archaeon]